MAEYGFSLEDVLDNLTVPQIRAFLAAREQRIAGERKWGVLVASVAVQPRPGEYIQNLMDLLDDIAGPARVRVSGDVGAPSGAPLLHEITPAMARAMRLPIHFIKVEDKDSGNG